MMFSCNFHLCLSVHVFVLIGKIVFPIERYEQSYTSPAQLAMRPTNRLLE